MAIRIAALWLVTGLGVLAFMVSAYYVLQDWVALNMYYARFEKLTMSDASLRSLFIAEAHQNAFRINCFADGVGALLGAVVSAIGIHGLCMLHRPPAAMSPVTHQGSPPRT